MLKYDRVTKQFYIMSAGGRRINLLSHPLLIKYVEDNKLGFWSNNQGETCAVDVSLPLIGILITVPVLEILQTFYDAFITELQDINCEVTTNDKFTTIIFEKSSGVLFKIIDK
jgi:hypothetical protein